MLSHANLVANARAVGRAWRWTADDHLLLDPAAVPHPRPRGRLPRDARPWGASLTLRRRFDAAEVVADLRGGGVTMFFGVPTMYARLLAEVGDAGVRAPGLRLLVSGSAPLAPDTLERVERAFGHRILERYGMTETVMLTGNPFEGPRKAGTVGVPFDGVELRLADPATDAPAADRRRRGPGEGHERHARVLARPRGDRARPSAPTAGSRPATSAGGTPTATSPDGPGPGAHHQRRVQRLPARGRGADRDAARRPRGRGGGSPDADLGERVAAAIALEPGHVARGRDRRGAVQAAPGGFKAPREVVFVEALPRNAMGKLLRHELRDALAGAG
jgi:malonyl-CoA/methylmalonyl-CoA synthetase